MFGNINLDIVESKSKRINKYEYENEIIVIDLSNYDRYKLEFKTRSSEFRIVEERDVNLFDKSSYIKFKESYFIKAEISRDMIFNNSELFKITKLDK